MAADGRLTHVTVIGYRKRYDPDKYYVYILRVEREAQAQFMDVLRTYKEFCELHQKLCLHFPLAKLHRYVMIKNNFNSFAISKGTSFIYAHLHCSI